MADPAKSQRAVMYYRMVDGEKVRYRMLLSNEMVLISDEPYVAQAKEVTLTPKQKTAMRFFSKATPCWFEGCEQLRQAYDAEIEALHASAKAKGVPCKGCQTGAVILKYRKLVEAALPEEPGEGQ